MNTQAAKTATKDPAAASRAAAQPSLTQPTTFVDNRPAAAQMRRLQEGINSSGRVQQLKAFPTVAAIDTQAEPTAQSSADENVVQLQRNRKRWSPQQRAQSQKFWAKKEAKEQRKHDARVARGMNQIRGQARAGLPQVAAGHVASGPAGNANPTPHVPGQLPVPPGPGATLKYGPMMDDVTNFLHPTHAVRSTRNAGGAQFIQQFDQAGTAVTRRVGIDVEPSAHVQGLHPHINLQTQHDGVIQGGPLADPHTPVRDADPFPAGHPLRGMRAEERRKFMERHLHSSGIPLQRQ